MCAIVCENVYKNVHVKVCECENVLMKVFAHSGP